jgi:hypothetical protein
MGGARVTLDGFWSVLNNQAGLATQRHFGLGAAAEQQFMLKETGTGSFGTVMPLGAYVFGFSVQHFGYTAYRQVKTGLALARKFGERISVGLQLDYLASHIAGGYGRSGGVTFETGVQVMLTDGLVLGAHAFNPLLIRYVNITDEKPSGAYVVGLMYRFTDQLFICIEIEKDIRYKPVVRSGVEYEISPLAVVRFGYSGLPAPVQSELFSQSSRLSIGYGLGIKRFRIDISAMWHTYAGWSPSVSMHYATGQTK